MRIFIATIAFAALTGCAANIQPIPGVEVGFDARPEAMGGTVSVNPAEAGCETAKAISWNWLEKQLCDDDQE